jgi:hypothetical protein
VTLGIILDFNCPHVYNIFLFPVNAAKVIGNFYNNRQNAAKRRPHLAYSFVSFMLRQNYRSCNLYTLTTGKAQQIKKICENFLLPLQICLASPIGAASVPASPICDECHRPLILAVATT